MDIETLTLSNGLRLVHKRAKTPVAYSSLNINVGTRNELPKEHGMAHFLEHVLFKGTQRRSALRIASYLENEGGDLNAFTTKEETAIHAVTLRADLGKAIDIISDIVFHSQFPETELEKEKDVVRDEINLYRDSPSELIFDEFEELMFPESSLGRSTLGTSKSLRTFTSKKVKEFIGRNYGTEGMVLSTVGNFGIEKVAKLAEKHIGDIPRSGSSPTREQAPPYTPFEKQYGRSTYQAHCLLGNRTFNYHSEQRFALHLLTNMLGGPSQNSRLNLALREKHGLAYGVEVASTLYSDSGVVTLYFGTDKQSLSKALAVVHDELERVRTERLTPMQLNKVKKQFLGQQAIASESNEALMLAIAKSMMIYNRVESMEDIEARIQAVTPEDILQVANEVFCREQLSSLIYG